VPELPDLVHVESVLARMVCGLRIAEVRVGDPVVLRLMVQGTLADLVTGGRIVRVERVGQYLCFFLSNAAAAGDLVLVINAMLTGRYTLVTAARPRASKDLLVALRLENGSELHYSDETRMGKIYVAGARQLSEIPGFRDLGVDLLSPGFTLEHFRSLVAKRRDQVRSFLLDKTALASIGNAYADEILFAAGIHPKTLCRQLGQADVDRLFAAVRDTLAWAIDEIAKRDPPIETKLRDFLKVRGRHGKPCLRCGATIRRVRVGHDDACFCPNCQPATRALFVDFRKVPTGSRAAPTKSDRRG
jgi:formamidopyrimidine-DNA glycosylase